MTKTPLKQFKMLGQKRIFVSICGVAHLTAPEPHRIKAAAFGCYAQLTRAVVDRRGEPKNSAIAERSGRRGRI